MTLDAKVLFCVTLKCLALFEEGCIAPPPPQVGLPSRRRESKLDGEKVIFEAPKHWKFTSLTLDSIIGLVGYITNLYLKRMGKTLFIKDNHNVPII